MHCFGTARCAQAWPCLSTGPRLTVVFLIFSVLAQGGGGKALNPEGGGGGRARSLYVTPPSHPPPPPAVLRDSGVGTMVPMAPKIFFAYFPFIKPFMF